MKIFNLLLCLFIASILSGQDKTTTAVHPTSLTQKVMVSDGYSGTNCRCYQHCNGKRAKYLTITGGGGDCYPESYSGESTVVISSKQRINRNTTPCSYRDTIRKCGTVSIAAARRTHCIGNSKKIFSSRAGTK